MVLEVEASERRLTTLPVTMIYCPAAGCAVDGVVTAGVVVGAGITAFTTPRSGAEARQNICDKKDSAVNGVKETSCRVADKIKETADDVVDKIKDKFYGDGEEEVVVEYTIRYDDEDEPTVETCGCGCEETEDAPAEEKPEEEAPSEE